MTARATFNDYDTLTVAGLKSINEVVTKEAAGKPVNFKINLDAGPRNAVNSRIVVDPAALAKVMTADIKLGVYFDQANDNRVKSVNSYFGNYYSNKLVTVVYDHASTLAVSAEFCAKLGLSKVFGQDSNLYYYSYDNAKNTYNRILNPGYWVDRNGYAHITAPLGGSIIISDKPLTRK